MVAIISVMRVSELLALSYIAYLHGLSPGQGGLIAGWICFANGGAYWHKGKEPPFWITAHSI